MSMDLFFVSGSPSENKFGQTAGEVLQEFFNKSDEPLAQAARQRGMITQVKDPKATNLRDALARQLFKWFHPGAERAPRRTRVSLSHPEEASPHRGLYL